MEDSPIKTVITFVVSASLLFFSSCERKSSEASQGVEVEDKKETPRHQKLSIVTDHPFLKEIDNQEVNERRSSKALRGADSLKDSGVDIQEAKLPEYASQLLLEVAAELQKATNQQASKVILNELAEKYWVPDFEKPVSLDGLNFHAVFGSSHKLVEELRSGGGTLELGSEELRASYGMFSIMALLSQSQSSKIEPFFSKRMNQPSAKIGDLLLARVAYQVRPFKAANSQESTQMLDDLRHAKNPVYRALAVVTGSTYLKEEEKLFEFYSKFENDPHSEVVILVLDELGGFSSKAAQKQIERIMEDSKGKKDLVYKHAKKLLANP